MLISTKSTEKLIGCISSSGHVFCSGLFLSARWFVVSEAARRNGGMHVLILPDKESAEYCAADLYDLIEGDRVLAAKRGVDVRIITPGIPDKKIRPMYSVQAGYT